MIGSHALGARVFGLALSAHPQHGQEGSHDRDCFESAGASRKPVRGSVSCEKPRTGNVTISIDDLR